MKMGVIGMGTVGSAMYKALCEFHDDVYGFDVDLKKSKNFWSEIVECDVVFVCVPTDKKLNGRLDTKNIDSVLTDLEKDGFDGVCVIRSTMSLGYIDNIIKMYLFPIIVFPEWLYAKNPLGTLLKPEMSIIGCKRRHRHYAHTIVNDICAWHKDMDTVFYYPEEAVLIKLTANALAATKISFANQIYLICKKYNIDADRVMNAIKKDPRCSPRYLTPNNPFGGYCLPKDTSELNAAMNGFSLFATVLWINELMKHGNAN